MSKDGVEVASKRITRGLVLLASALAIAGCASSSTKLGMAPEKTTRTAGDWKTASAAHARTKTLREVRVPSATPRATPASFEGLASYYSEGSHVATGARYHPDEMTAAHRSLPFGTRLRVRDMKTGRSVVVVVNDRGPFVHGRVLDLSLGAARALGIEGSGVNRIHADVL